VASDDSIAFKSSRPTTEARFDLDQSSGIAREGDDPPALRTARFGRAQKTVLPGGCDMNTAYLTALSALAGSVVGGFTAGITTWMSLRSAARQGRFAAELARRQDLFQDFIIAASNAYSHALMSDEPQIQELIGVYAIISRMRILCSPDIIACAEKIMRLTVDTYFEPNRTIEELHGMIKTETVIDPLREFSELARMELEAVAS
jgi:hypothetical protein